MSQPVYLADDIRDLVIAFCEREGCSITSLFRAFAMTLRDPTDSHTRLVKVARLMDAENRRRGTRRRVP